jgi:hypothetical protein
VGRAILKVSGGALLAVAIAAGAIYMVNRPPPGRLTLAIETKPALMSAAYKVYGNRAVGNGRYWLSKVVLKNEGGSALENVSTSYRVPGLIEWSTPTTYPRILPGQTIVSLYYPQLPDSLATKTTTTTEHMELKVEYADRRGEQHESRQMDFQLRGRNDLIYTTLPESEVLNVRDLYENTDLAAAFVTPDDPVIKYFVAQLESKAMGGTMVGAGADPKEIARFMATVYAFEQLSGIVYAGTEGLPEKSGSSMTMIQKVRLPREVLLGGSGLCIELAALFATISEAAGLDPVIFMTTIHAFPGLKVNNDLVGFEATAVGIPGMGEKRVPFEAALKRGMEEKDIWLNGGNRQIGQRIMMLDLHYLHHVSGIVPPELPDDPAARQKIDEILARLLGGAGNAQQQQAPAPRQGARSASSQAPRTAPAPPPRRRRREPLLRSQRLLHGGAAGRLARQPLSGRGLPLAGADGLGCRLDHGSGCAGLSWRAVDGRCVQPSAPLRPIAGRSDELHRTAGRDQRRPPVPAVLRRHALLPGHLDRLGDLRAQLPTGHGDVLTPGQAGAAGPRVATAAPDIRHLRPGSLT